ncbi:hypothetical protein [Cohnella yongneupensis]|uniref:Uncharacterized protein n=1 Tax=Cohnella yongneupensis TaxID=425006 RepID=A0ABW0QZI0_9BACL
MSTLVKVRLISAAVILISIFLPYMKLGDGFLSLSVSPFKMITTGVSWDVEGIKAVGLFFSIVPALGLLTLLLRKSRVAGITFGIISTLMSLLMIVILKNAFEDWLFTVTAGYGLYLAFIASIVLFISNVVKDKGAVAANASKAA